jgi:hypothetical protein
LTVVTHQLASALMRGFATVTGLTGAARPQRYLWTDAFAVCNFLGLHQVTGKGEYLELALKLVDQVHHVLGRQRDDDIRRGWISGLGEEDGERHPTRGGLRIGKALPERLPREALDARLEWERDGQYLHYLTQWMHALHRVSEETGNPAFGGWAIELAKAAHAAFARPADSSGPARMVWKMSIDLGRVLVPSMGQHDAVDAWVTYLELQDAGPLLEREIRDTRELCKDAHWETDDPLGIGSLLILVHRLAARLIGCGEPEQALLGKLLVAAQASLASFARDDTLNAPASARLAFRELGLAVGLHGIGRISGTVGADQAMQHSLAMLKSYARVGRRIDDFWTEPRHRRSMTWTEHEHINDVMLATSLLPDGYLGKSLRRADRPR